jgi:TolB protein
MPARVYADASDGRSYVPDGAFHRAMMVFDRHSFHTAGEAEIEMPVGSAKIEALRGWEYRPASATVDVRAGAVDTITLRLERLVDLSARGWYSGDTHEHDLHQGFGLTHEAFFGQLVAEDLHVTNALIHMDGTRLMGRWTDLTGAPHPLSTATHILQYAQEFRGGLGHVGMIGTREFILPFVAGQPGTPYAQHTLENGYFAAAHAQGGLAGYMHPYLTPPRTPAAAASTLIAIDAALGLGDFYDVSSLYSDELGSAGFYYRLLNAGFRIAATGGTDNFSDVWRDPPPGSARTYARIDGPLSHGAWLDAIRRGRTFSTTGPLIFLTVNDREPGDSIALGAAAPSAMRVHAEAMSIAPLDSLQIIVNGAAVRTVAATDRARIVFDGDIDLPQGGWLAARVLGPASPYFGDDYAFAHTGPVYVTRAGRRWIGREDVAFLSATVEAISARVERAAFRTPEDRAAFMATVDSARSVYRRLGGG